MPTAERSTAETEVVVYPSEDGEPMAETEIHAEAIIQLREFLEDLLAGRADVFIGTDQYWFWEEGNPDARKAPDVMVVFGVAHQEPRSSFFSWLEGGLVPAVIFEIASEKTWRADLEEKYELYERLGVREYFIFDPEGLYIRPQLQGFRLQDGGYRPIPLNPDGSRTSVELGVRIVAEGLQLRLIEERTGQKLLSRKERIQQYEREVATLSAELARLKAQLDALTKKDDPKGP